MNSEAFDKFNKLLDESLEDCKLFLFESFPVLVKVHVVTYLDKTKKLEANLIGYLDEAVILRDGLQKEYRKNFGADMGFVSSQFKSWNELEMIVFQNPALNDLRWSVDSLNGRIDTLNRYLWQLREVGKTVLMLYNKDIV